MPGTTDANTFHGNNLCNFIPGGSASRASSPTGGPARRSPAFTSCRRALCGARASDRDFAYVSPFLKQSKAVAWDYLREAAFYPGAGGTINESELRVDYPNGGQVRLYGADNPDALRGIYLDGVVLDEYADMDPRLWSEVIRPALADRKGWAVFIGTPKGRNALFDTWTRASADPLKVDATDMRCAAGSGSTLRGLVRVSLEPVDQFLEVVRAGKDFLTTASCALAATSEMGSKSFSTSYGS